MRKGKKIRRFAQEIVCRQPGNGTCDGFLKIVSLFARPCGTDIPVLNGTGIQGPQLPLKTEFILRVETEGKGIFPWSFGKYRINQHGWTRFLMSQPQQRMKIARIGITFGAIFGKTGMAGLFFATDTTNDKNRLKEYRPVTDS